MIWRLSPQSQGQRAFPFYVLLHCALASCGTVYCNRSCLGLFVGLEIVCIDPHQTGFVGKGSDHLQLIKFWPSRAPGKGVCSGVKISGSALLQPACSVCISVSTFSFYCGFVCLLAYTIYFILLWHDVACLCQKCR